MNNITEKEALCFLQTIDGFHNKKLNKFKSQMGSYSSILAADDILLTEELGLEDALAIITAREKGNITSALNELKARKISYYLLSDADYPDSLKSISSAPPAIYVKGRLPDPFSPKVAIIGARNCTAYGSQMAKSYARELAGHGVQIISGMARGVDGIAELAALEAGGYVCSVLGCGVDVCYPKENRIIYDRSLSAGGIISEYPPGTAPLPRFFPPRNRIISGLADAILVIEARERSGTLITVDMALDQGRDIYALPGRTTDPLSFGCNRLIHQGAVPLLSPEAFLEEFLGNFNLTPSDTSTEKPAFTDRFLTTDERLIMSVLDFIPKSISEIYCSLTDKTSMSIPSLMQLLTNMTLQRKIKCIDGCNYYIEED